MNFRHLITLAGLLWLLAACAPARSRAEDVVYLQSASPDAPPLIVRGEVIFYTGDKLVVKLATGEDRTYPLNTKVLQIETTQLPEYEQGLAAYDSGKFEEALQLFSSAFERENRAWVQREILSRIISCHQNLGQWVEAGQRFLTLVSSDPKTPYFQAMPLAWVSDPPPAPLENQAKVWLASGDPVARLLGASHILPVNKAEAEAVFADLRFHADQRIAAIARMQLWRTDMHRVTIDLLKDWKRDLDRSPPETQAGGFFLLGMANLQTRNAQDAALWFMRVPIHFPQQRRLGARAMLEAAGQLEAIGQKSEAVRLYTELVDAYAAFPESRAAADRLKSLNIQN